MYKAMVLTCVDPRFQPIIYNYLSIKRKLKGKYSFFSIAGGAIGVTNIKFKRWHKTFWENLSTSIKLHKIKLLIVINHNDCGAAKIISKKIYNAEEEIKIHINSFKDLKKKFKKRHPKLKIEFNYINLKGVIRKY